MFIRRLRYWLSRTKRDAALREEIALHLEEKAAELRESGLSDAAARAAARRLFGNPAVRQEESREIWISRYWSEFWQDLRYGARTLLAQPGFSLAAVAALVLGIGVNTFVFNVFNSLAWEPWTIRDPQSAVQVLGERSSGRWLAFTFPNFRYLQANARSVAAMAADIGMEARVTQGDVPWDAEVGAVTANFFDVLAPAMTLGHGFSAGVEDRAPAPQVVLSHETWRTHFGGDVNVIGTSIELNRHRLQIIGVASAGFNGATITRTDMWVGAGWHDILRPGEPSLHTQEACCVSVVARLKPDVSRQAAQAELTGLHTQYLSSLKLPARRVLLVAPSFLANPTRLGQTFPIFLLVGVTALLILLLACANVANLQLARAAARRHEIALRVSLGASRGRILRQLMVESLCLSTVAGIASIALSAWLPRWVFGQLIGPEERLTFTFGNDTRVLLFIVGATVATALLFGLAPALGAVRTNAGGGAQKGNRATSRNRTRAVLLGVQVALCAILLSGTALLARSVDRVRHVDAGLPVQNLLVMSTHFDASGLKPGQARALLASLMDRASVLPGVESVALASRIPFGEQCGASAKDPRTGDQTQVTMHEISANFFDTVRVPILAGRNFETSDAGRHVVIVSQATAQRFWPGEAAVGKTLQLSTAAEVIGVVRNFGTEDFGSARDVYELVESAGRCDNLLVIRHAGGPTALAAELVKQGTGLDHRFILSVVPYGQILAKARRATDLAASVAAILGGLSLVLACLGIYGVAAYGVSQRVREIGVRAALGARPREILAMVLTHNLRTVLIGAVVGVVGAIGFGRLLTSLLYGVSPADPVSLAMSMVLLIATATLAAWIPARRASRVDPAITLRHD